MSTKLLSISLILFSAFSFQLSAFSLDAPKLLTPRHDEPGTNARPTFTWRAVKDATAYEIEVAADYLIKTPVIPTTRVTNTTFTPEKPLHPSPRFWRVRAIDAKNTPGPWSPIFCYRLSKDPNAPATPTPPPAAAPKPRTISSPIAALGTIYPKHDQRGIIPNPSFTWETAPNVIAYEIEIAADFNFDKPVLPATRVDTPRYVPLTPLYPASRFWRTRAITADNKPGPWSPARTYQLRAPANTINIPANATLAQIRDAIAAAPANSLINFPPKATYRLKPSDADGTVFALSNRDDLIIDGNDSTFIIENPAAGIATLKDCQRIVIRRLTIDYDPLPHSIGTVVSVNPAATSDAVSKITLRRLPGYPDFDAPHMLAHWTWGVILDPQNPGRMKTGAPLVVSYTNTQKTLPARNPSAPDLFDIPIPNANNAKFFAPNDRVIIFAREKTRGLFNSDSTCADITYDRITVHAAPAGHFGAIGSSDIKILSCREVRKDATRLYAGNADGAHIRSNLLGPWIENCAFETLGDDAIALYNKGISIIAKTAPDTLTVAADFMDLTPGDRFVIFNPHNGRLVGATAEHKVTSVKTLDAKTRSITFTPTLPATAELPAGNTAWWKNAQLFNRTRCNAGFVIRNNTFTNIRRYSIVARATDGVIRGNTITGSSNTAIALINEPISWGNGLHSERVLITENTINDCAFDRSSENTGSITVNLRNLSDTSADRTQKKDTSTVSAPLHRNIRITNNIITNWNHHAILLRGATDCEVTGNTIGPAVINGTPIETDNTVNCTIQK